MKKDTIINVFLVVLFIISCIGMIFLQTTDDLKSDIRTTIYTNNVDIVDDDYLDDDIEYEHLFEQENAKKKQLKRESANVDALIETNNTKLVELLEDAANDEDWKTVKKIADKIFAISNWQSNITEEVQDALKNALSNFMPNSFPEMISLLESSYEDIYDDVLDEILQAIDECEDQADAASLIVKFSAIITDEDFIEYTVLEIGTFEPINAATAMIGILKNGNNAFKQAMANEIEDITDQPEFSEHAILKWLET